MTDYVIINVDGSLTEGDGYPREVGCHEVYGQMLTPRARNGSVWRLVRCTQSLAMPQRHPLNDVARMVLIGLNRSIEPEEIRGAAALLYIGADHEQLPIPPIRLHQLRQLVRVACSLDNLMETPADFQARLGGVWGPL